MNLPSSFGQALRIAAVAIGAFAAATGVAAQQPPALQVTVAPDHFVTGGRRVATLDALEAAVREHRPAAIVIDACGAGAARLLLAAVHRLRAYPLRLRPPVDSCEGADPDALRRVSASDGAAAIEVDEAAVSRYWATLQP